jgi:hypothetical protein
LGWVTVAVVCACTGSRGGVTQTTAPAVMAPATETTATTANATTANATTTVPTAATTIEGPPTPTVPDGPSGSGCTPGVGVSLAEGEWYGVVVSASPSGIEFDLACWFVGESAVKAASEDGAEPPPNDYYVRNDNPQIRSLPVSPETEVIWYPTGDPASQVIVTFSAWVEGVTSRGLFFGVWLDVIDGEVLRIREQWVP